MKFLDIQYCHHMCGCALRYVRFRPSVLPCFVVAWQAQCLTCEHLPVVQNCLVSTSRFNSSFWPTRSLYERRKTERLLAGNHTYHAICSMACEHRHIIAFEHAYCTPDSEPPCQEANCVGYTCRWSKLWSNGVEAISCVEQGGTTTTGVTFSRC